MACILGIDIGTSGTKTLLADERGRILADVTVEYPCASPRPGWSEQRPEDWWTAAVKGVRQALAKAKVKGGAVRGIGLSGQMHGLVCLDAAGRVLRPAILWNDQRTGAECAEITRLAGGQKKLLSLVANPALTGFTAPKILWVRKHEPKIYAQTKKMLLPKDYLRYRLTGEFATDVSDASGTLLLDVKRRIWCKPLLDKLAIDPAALPRVYESCEVTGGLSAGAAKELGLPVGLPVAAGAGDQAAGAVGAGIVRTGIVSATLGTSGVVFAHLDQVQTDPGGRVHTFCHAVPGKWHVMSVALAAGGSFQWFRNHLGGEESALARKAKCDPYELLVTRAEQAEPGAEGLFFLPYLTGERTPHADPFARACFIGLTPRHGKNEMVRAVLEGVTYALRDGLEIMRAMGVKPREIRLSGGGARSPFWAQMQADIFGANACLTGSHAGSAYGAMLLGGVASGVWPGVPQACAATVKTGKSFKARPKATKVYDKHYAVYRDLYPALRGEFAKLAALAEG